MAEQRKLQPIQATSTVRTIIVPQVLKFERFRLQQPIPVNLALQGGLASRFNEISQSLFLPDLLSQQIALHHELTEMTLQSQLQGVYILCGFST